MPLNLVLPLVAQKAVEELIEPAEEPGELVEEAKELVVLVEEPEELVVLMVPSFYLLMHVAV